MIELAPEEYWKELSLDEAVMYCFTLTVNGKIGWRLPTKDDSKTILKRFRKKYPAVSWWESYDFDNKDDCWHNDIFTTIPVRDLKDD